MTRPLLSAALVLPVILACDGGAAPGAYRGVHDTHGVVALSLDQDGHYEATVQTAVGMRSRELGGTFEVRGDTVHFSGALPFRSALRRGRHLMALLPADSLLLRRE